MKRKTAFVLLFALLIYTTYVYFDLGTVLSFESIKEQRESLQVMVDTHPVASVVLFSLAYFAIVVTSIPVATVMTLLGGFLFGAMWGGVIVVVSATLGAIVTFLLARWLFQDWFLRKFGDRIQRVLGELKEDAMLNLLVLRFVPIVPFFILNMAPAFTRMTTRQYVIATVLGITPGSFIYAYAGRELGSIERVADIASPGVLTAFTLLAVLALVPIIYRRWKRRHTNTVRKEVIHNDANTHDSMNL